MRAHWQTPCSLLSPTSGGSSQVSEVCRCQRSPRNLARSASHQEAEEKDLPILSRKRAQVRVIKIVRSFGGTFWPRNSCSQAGRAAGHAAQALGPQAGRPAMLFWHKWRSRWFLPASAERQWVWASPCTIWVMAGRAGNGKGQTCCLGLDPMSRTSTRRDQMSPPPS